jgi:hypothetical protein
MAQQKFVNIFDGGLNKDSDPKTLENNQYTNALNIDITGSGAFRVARPIQGSTFLNSIPVSFTNVKVLGCFETTYLISDVATSCATLFVIFDDQYNIWVCPLSGSSPIKVYEKTVDSSEYTAVDAKLNSENGIDYLYFVDGVNPPGKLRCVLPISTLLSDTEISLLKRAPLGLKISDFSVTSGGDLLCGSYPTCVRYYNNNTGKVSAWSIPTLPIKVHLDPTAEDRQFHTSGRNVTTSKQIVYSIAFSNSTEKALYTHYQLGVIENVDTDSPSQVMSVLPPVELPVGSSTTYNYKSNFKVNTTTIDDVVIEPAPIKTAKTLEIKDNRLFLGNITYKNLEYDNGTPKMNDPSILVGDVTTTVAKVQPSDVLDSWYVNDTYASKYVGYFRDEVYRFAISYYDENYNFSAPSVLDMSDVVGNQISGSSTDMKFPSRHIYGYSLLNSDNIPVALGLRLSCLDNHPSWAVGFVILRAKRKENILGQSPIIPATKIEPTLAVYEFPTRPVQAYREFAGSYSYDFVDYSSASPAENPTGITVPKNMLRSVPTDIVRYSLSEFGGLFTELVKYSKQTDSRRWLFFHPGSMFQSQTGTFLEPYSLKAGDRLKTIDVALQRRSTRTYGTNDLSLSDGEYVESETDTNFFSTRGSDYYSLRNSSSGWTSFQSGISDYVFIDNRTSSAVFNSGERIEDYNSVMETVVPDSVVPTPLRKGYVELKDSHADINLASYASTQSTPFGSITAGSVYVNGSRISFDWSNANSTASKYGNAYAYNGSAVTKPNYQYIEIANIERGLADDRYGESEAYHEYIYTGAHYEFTDFEKSSLRSGGNPRTNRSTGIVVYGGDCYISYVNYKVTDSHFAVSNDKLMTTTTLHPDTVASRFKYGFYVRKGPIAYEASRPVPYKAEAQTISCYIESKYNLDVQVRAGVFQTGETTNSDIPYVITNSKAEARIPYNYVIQPELSFENTYKIWIPRLESQIVRDRYRSRILFSNEKIYQSDIEGFDVFNALDYYDLSESYGDITKLIASKDTMYAIQDSAVLYIPINANVLETSDGASLQVRSSAVIDKPKFISNTLGAQSIQAVTRGNNGIFFIDQRRGKIVGVGGDGTAILSDVGMKRHFESSISPSSYVDLFYDLKRDKLYAGIGSVENSKDRYVFDGVIGKWITRITTNQLDAPYGFIYASNIHDKFLVFSYNTGYSSGQLSYGTWNTAVSNAHMNVILRPEITFIANPNPGQPKTFNNLVVDVTNNIDNAVCKVYRDTSFGNQSTVALDLTQDHRHESNYKIAILRDTLNGDNSRLRGSFMEVTLQWPSTLVSVETKLASVTTKYLDSRPRI